MTSCIRRVFCDCGETDSAMLLQRRKTCCSIVRHC